jgi:hypothetical protein
VAVVLADNQHGWTLIINALTLDSPVREMLTGYLPEHQLPR